MSVLLEGLLTVLAALAAWIYPDYGARLPAHIDMTDPEAHLMAVYLSVIGAVFIALRPRHKPPPEISLTAPGSEPPADEAAPPPELRRAAEEPKSDAC